jgi:hypothetical protein
MNCLLSRERTLETGIYLSRFVVFPSFVIPSEPEEQRGIYLTEPHDSFHAA